MTFPDQTSKYVTTIAGTIFIMLCVSAVVFSSREPPPTVPDTCQDFVRVLAEKDVNLISCPPKTKIEVNHVDRDAKNIWIIKCSCDRPVQIPRRSQQ